MWRRLLVGFVALAVCCSLSAQSPLPQPSSSAHTLSDAEVASLLSEADSTIAERSATIDKLSLRLELADKRQTQLESAFKMLLVGCGVLLAADVANSAANLIHSLK